MSILKLCGLLLKHAVIICVVSIIVVVSTLAGVMVFEPLGVHPVILFFVGSILGFIGGGYVLIALVYLGVIWNFI